MIAVIIFALHLIAAGYAFHTRRKKDGPGEGILAVAFMGLIFSVGWTMTTVVTRLIFPPEGLAPWLDADTISLVILTFGETIFYAVLLRGSAEQKNESPTST